MHNPCYGSNSHTLPCGSFTHTDGRFASAQTALMLQEETIRRNERERKIMTDKLTNLERSLNSTDTEKKQLQDRVVKLKNVSQLDGFPVAYIDTQ